MPCSEKNYLHLVDDSTGSSGLRRQDNSVLSAHKYQQQCIGMVYHVILIASTVHKAVFACCNGILNILLYSGTTNPLVCQLSTFRNVQMSIIYVLDDFFPHSGGKWQSCFFLVAINQQHSVPDVKQFSGFKSWHFSCRYDNQPAYPFWGFSQGDPIHLMEGENTGSLRER